MYEDVVVVLPAYNEGKHIKGVLKRIHEVCPGLQAVVVSDGSKDNTVQEAQQDAVVLDNKSNNGKGFVARQGCDWAVKNGFKKIILMDSDGQHKPEDIPFILQILEKVD